MTSQRPSTKVKWKLLHSLFFNKRAWKYISNKFKLLKFHVQLHFWNSMFLQSQQQIFGLKSFEWHSFSHCPDEAIWKWLCRKRPSSWSHKIKKIFYERANNTRELIFGSFPIKKSIITLERFFPMTLEMLSWESVLNLVKWYRINQNSEPVKNRRCSNVMAI